MSGMVGYMDIAVNILRVLASFKKHRAMLPIDGEVGKEVYVGEGYQLLDMISTVAIVMRREVAESLAWRS